ncbi:Plasmodium vivax Vir protein, putative [Plasmodium vivax]|uniref:Vir protein, putative n=1 Tax=Plasmodium vivax TaxID=5855 RepID=A0A1G4HI29_PLAVI|nr:Plasmodium vivax Vir protein, putative [Plasmodium vivax]
MSDIDENKQIPRIFYNRLDKHEDISSLYRLLTNKAFLILVEKDKIKEILAKLLRNIRLIFSEYSGNHEKRCREVNHWINKEIKAYKDENREDISSYVLTVFNDVKLKTVNRNMICNRNENPYRTDYVDLLKELDDYCEIRDNNGCNALKNKNECEKYNSYIRGMKEHFSSQINEKCIAPKCNRNEYKIDDSCTLNNMDLTFPEINCEFTPVGSIIHRFRGRKYDLKRNIERVDDDRYSLYHSDAVPSDTENKRYYIEYGRPNN